MGKNQVRKPNNGDDISGQDKTDRPSTRQAGKSESELSGLLSGVLTLNTVVSLALAFVFTLRPELLADTQNRNSELLFMDLLKLWGAPHMMCGIVSLQCVFGGGAHTARLAAVPTLLFWLVVVRVLSECLHFTFWTRTVITALYGIAWSMAVVTLVALWQSSRSPVSARGPRPNKAVRAIFALFTLLTFFAAASGVFLKKVAWSAVSQLAVDFSSTQPASATVAALFPATATTLLGTTFFAACAVLTDDFMFTRRCAFGCTAACCLFAHAWTSFFPHGMLWSFNVILSFAAVALVFSLMFMFALLVWLKV